MSSSTLDVQICGLEFHIPEWVLVNMPSPSRPEAFWADLWKAIEHRTKSSGKGSARLTSHFEYLKTTILQEQKGFQV